MKIDEKHRKFHITRIPRNRRMHLGKNPMRAFCYARRSNGNTIVTHDSRARQRDADVFIRFPMATPRDGYFVGVF